MMNRFGRIVLILGLILPILATCGEPEGTDRADFEALARRVPADAEQVFFLNFEPAGETGEYWARIRRELEANPETEEVLGDLLSEFKVEEYGLEEVIAGPAASGFRSAAGYVVVQVTDDAQTAEALHRTFEGVTWEEVAFDGLTLYEGRIVNAWDQPLQLAWTVDDGYLYLVTRYDGAPLPALEELVSLAREDSLAALPAWKTLSGRLPKSAMGVAFMNIAEQTRRYPPAPDSTSLGDLLGQQLEAFTLAAVPEAGGMRVEIDGIFGEEREMPAELQALLNLAAVDPAEWAVLPPDTALALVAHDASTIWPWAREMFSLDSRGASEAFATVGLDPAADLFGAGGPLGGDFALAVTPPLPNQPVIEGLTAAQLLFQSPDTTEAQAQEMRAAMEGRGAVFGPGEAEGVAVQIQAGTAASGYAIAYGFDDGLFYLGSSPDVIGRGAAARREGDGLVTTDAFERVLAALPGKPDLFAYVHGGTLIDLARANMTAEEYGLRSDLQILEAFEALGLGLRLGPDRMEGVLYFSMPE